MSYEIEFGDGPGPELDKYIILYNVAANKIWERHALLTETIGVMREEQESFDNVTTLFYVAVGAFPVLAVLEVILYYLYQTKVS